MRRDCGAPSDAPVAGSWFADASRTLANVVYRDAPQIAPSSLIGSACSISALTSKKFACSLDQSAFRYCLSRPGALLAAHSTARPAIDRQQLRHEKRRTTVAILQVVSSTVAPSKSPHWLQNSTPPAGPDFIPYKANQHRSDANTRHASIRFMSSWAMIPSMTPRLIL